MAIKAKLPLSVRWVWSQPVLRRQIDGVGEETFAEPQYCGPVATVTRCPCWTRWCPKPSFEQSKAQMLLGSREIRWRARDRCEPPPSCPLFVKYNFPTFKVYLGGTGVQLPGTIAKWTAPPHTPSSSTVSERGERKYQTGRKWDPLGIERRFT